MASVTSSIIPNRLSAVLSRSFPKYESGGNSRLVSKGVLTYLISFTESVKCLTVLLPSPRPEYLPWANGIYPNVHVPVAIRIRSCESDDSYIISTNATEPGGGKIHRQGEGAVSPCLEATYGVAARCGPVALSPYIEDTFIILPRPSRGP